MIHPVISTYAIQAIIEYLNAKEAAAAQKAEEESDERFYDLIRP